MIPKEVKITVLFIFFAVLIVVILASSNTFLGSLGIFAPAPANGTVGQKVQIELLSDQEAQIIYNNQTYSAEIADTPAERTRGLMFREKLDADKGMLFIFDREAIYPFWMKNTLIPLKIIWIDQDFTVVHEEIAQPCQADPCPNYNPGKEALYILEIGV